MILDHFRNVDCYITTVIDDPMIVVSSYVRLEPSSKNGLDQDQDRNRTVYIGRAFAAVALDLSNSTTHLTRTQSLTRQLRILLSFM